MEKLLNKLKNRKGFTLVELIVVLVILAILAALLVPALTGYIDKANKDKVIAECRQVVMASQTVASEAYALGALKLENTEAENEFADTAPAEIATLAEAKDGWKFKVYISISKVNDSIPVGTIVKVEFWDGSTGCTYDATAAENFTVGTPASSDAITTSVVPYSAS